MVIIRRKSAKIQQTSTVSWVEIPQIERYNIIVKYITDLDKKKRGANECTL